MTILFSPSTGGFYPADFAALPPDAVEITAERHAELLDAQAAGQVIACDEANQPVAIARPAPTADEIQVALTALVQRHLDQQAQAMGYDHLVSAVSYAEEAAVPRFQAEGRALRAWRSLVWARCIEILEAVTAGTRPVPTAQQLIAELPTFTSP